MLDIKVVRTDPERVKAACRSRNKDLDAVVDEILAIDEKCRAKKSEAEALKAEQNKASKEIPMLKKNGGDITAIMARMKEISGKVGQLDSDVSELENKQRELMLTIPNIPHPSVPIGKDDSENVEIRRWGEPRKFEFTPKAHWDLGTDLDILDPERAAKVTGKRFHFYKGYGARLERSVMNYFLNTHTANGYTEILPPFMANAESMTGTGQLPKFAEDMFKLEGLPYYLIPTAEVPVTNFHRDEILDGKDLPLYYCAYSGCFRAEAGSAGRDTRGLIRQHQFNKVELVKFVEPEHGYEELETLTNEAEKVLQGLGLPYRVVALSSGDLGFSSAKTYDLEVWMPSYNRYVEISSCSCFEDFQARRLQCRYRKNPGDKPQLVYTLNGSGLAIGRTTAAILENYQNADGSVTVPEALRAMMGCDVIK